MNYWVIGLFFSGLSIGIYYKEYIKNNVIKFLIKIIGIYYVNKNRFIKFYFKEESIKIRNIDEFSPNNTLINSYKYLNNMPYLINNSYHIDYYYGEKIFTIIFDKENILDKNLFNNKLLLPESKKFSQGDDDIILIELSSNDDIFDKKYIPNDEEQGNKILTIVKKYSGPKGNFYSDILYYKFNSVYLKNEFSKLLGTKNININIMYSNGDIINY
jgi:hypothetical protein